MTAILKISVEKIVTCLDMKLPTNHERLNRERNQEEEILLGKESVCFITSMQNVPVFMRLALSPA